MRAAFLLKCLGIGAVIATAASITTTQMGAEPLPTVLSGTWHITRILPAKTNACWNDEQAQPLVGSALTYTANAMRWKGGEVPVQEVSVHMTTEAEYRAEATLDEGVEFAALGLRGRVMEVSLQHEDAEITGSTTEVPGDTILIAGPNRIIVSACGVYYEARRTPSGKAFASR